MARVESLPGVTGGEARLDRAERRREGRRHGPGPLERQRGGARHRRSRRPPGSSPSPRARAASASPRSPSTWPPRWPPGASRVGVLDADIWGFSVPRMLGVEGRLEGADRATKKIVPNEQPDRATGVLEVVSMGFLVDEEESALMWRGLMLNRAVQHFLEDVRWGDLDYLLIDMPPGTGDVQMGLARMLPRAEMIIVTTPAPQRPEGRRRGPPTWPARRYLRIAGRHREHERLRLRARRDATRCSARAAARTWPTRPACPCSARSRSSPPWPPAATRAGPSPSATGRRPRPSGPSPPASSTRPCRRSRWPAAPPACSRPPWPPSTPRTRPTRTAAEVP